MSLGETAVVHDWDGVDIGAAIEFCYDQGWSDGLPVVPPLERLVADMVSVDSRPPETVICSHPATARECTLLAAAVNAVMAGCRPEYFPVVVAALEAANEPAFSFHASTASTGGSAPLVVVSGAIVDAIGMNAGAGVCGSGNRANATIGRALRLVIVNVFQMIPGISDQSTQGHPGKFSFCIAERADACPWEPLSVDRGFHEDDSTVTVYAGAGFNNIENHGGQTPEHILLCAADAMASLSAITAGQAVVVLSPEHVRIIGDAGWSRRDVKEYLYQNAWRTPEQLRAVGKYRQREHGRYTGDQVHRGHGADDVLVVVAGGDAGGHSAFIPSWSRTRGSIMQSVKVRI